MIRFFFHFFSRGLHTLLGTGAVCRFEPTCSHYAGEAFERFGFFKGTLLTFFRISRCHPWGSYGIDPVPTSFVWRRALWHRARG